MIGEKNMTNILDGKYVSQILTEKLKEEYSELMLRYKRKAGLAFIAVGNDEASKIYLKNKARKCEKVGIYQETYRFDENVSDDEILEVIEKLNNDQNIDGILIQLPLPKSINYSKIMSKVSPNKDVDGFHPENIGNLVCNDSGIYSCTPQGIMDLLDYYNISVSSKDVVIIGRSNIVGKPMALMMINEGATVQVCNSKTKDLEQKAANADILISATGQARLVNSKFVKEGAVIIDVGISSYEGKISGDVDFDEVIKNSKVGYITPVPGGVGPMTVYSLMKNTIKAYKINNEKK